MSITALVLGIIGVLAGLIPLLAFAAIVLGVLAVVFGLVGRKRGKPKMGVIGAALGLVAVILSIIGFVVLFNATNKLAEDLKTIGPNVSTPGATVSAGAYDAAKDVSVTRCTTEGSLSKAQLAIENHSTKALTYSVQVEFVKDGVRTGEGYGTASSLAPGQKADVEALGTGEGTECKIVKVTTF